MNTNILYTDADEILRERIAREWGEMQARHIHLGDGFALVALAGDQLAGMISIAWKTLPPPLPETAEAFIDIIEVAPGFRRSGIASRLVELSSERAKTHEAYQVRAWSSEDKTEAIPLWKYLGFGMCPATTFPRGQEVKGYFVAKVL
jgi:GNAT superfamily N-acetyltransferase